MADALNHGYVVGDEEQRYALTLLNAQQQVGDLSGDGDVQRRDRHIGDDDLGFDRQVLGDTDALALTAVTRAGLMVGKRKFLTRLKGTCALRTHAVNRALRAKTAG